MQFCIETGISYFLFVLSYKKHYYIAERVIIALYGLFKKEFICFVPQEKLLSNENCTNQFQQYGSCWKSINWVLSTFLRIWL